MARTSGSLGELVATLPEGAAGRDITSAAGGRHSYRPGTKRHLFVGRAAASSKQETAPSPSTGHHEFRRDLQGLRAVAVLLVAFSHANVPHFAGGYVGVDVFFVISGYLITGWILRRGEQVGRVTLGSFYAARARRILPAAALTLVATTVTSLYLLNFLEVQSAFHDSLWAAVFLANFHFAHVGTDYFASTMPPSPIQHFWSLAVEEQFYLAWPLLVLTAMPWGIRRRPKSEAPERGGMTGWGQARLVAMLVAGVIVSFLWSVHATASNPAAAYFSPFTRAWELGIGCLVALGTAFLQRMTASLRAAASWVGLGAIVVAAVSYSSSTAFPGYAALLPVGGAALVIIAGLPSAAPFGTGALLGRQPLRYVGDVSYSFYLWHWPVLIIASDRAGHSLSTLDNLMLLCLAFALSAVSYTLVERPIHKGARIAKGTRAFALWPVTIGIVWLAAFFGFGAVQAEIAGWSAPTRTSSAFALQSGAWTGPTGSATPSKAPSSDSIPPVKDESPGQSLGSLYDQAVVDALGQSALGDPVTGSLLQQIEEDQTPRYQQCVGTAGHDTSPICHLGAARSSHVVVVYGDSHAQEWLPALVYVADKAGWQLVPVIHTGCTAIKWSSDPTAPGPTPIVGLPNLRVQHTQGCEKWHSWAMREISALHPQAIVYATAYSWGASYGGSSMKYDLQGLSVELAGLHKIVPRVVVLDDSPYWPAQDPVQCLLSSGATLGRCVLGLPSSNPSFDDQVTSIIKSTGASFIPTSQLFCAKLRCPSVIAGIVVYRDQSHIDGVYSTYLGPALYVAVAAAIK
jgi:peptidoglycan/LPS O-acetylase OafA/YrhL